jgi:hypothetical protein
VASDIPATHLVTLPHDSYFTAGDNDALAQAMTRELQHERQLVHYDLDAFEWQTIAHETHTIYTTL